MLPRAALHERFSLRRSALVRLWLAIAALGAMLGFIALARRLPARAPGARR